MKTDHFSIQDLFVIDLEFIPGDVDTNEKYELIKAFSQNENCAGTLEMTSCTLESAIGDYDVLIKGDTVTLEGTPTIVQLANNTRGTYHWNSYMEWYDSTLAGKPIPTSPR